MHQMFAVKLLDQLKEWGEYLQPPDRQSAWVSCENQKGVAVEAEDGSIIGIATASGVLEALANSSNVPPAQSKEQNE